jgi:hypothetical protein
MNSHVVRKVEDGQLVYHCECCCAEGRWAWDNGEMERQRWVELRWRGALAREDVK